jgi:cytochrome P450
MIRNSSKTGERAIEFSGRTHRSLPPIGDLVQIFSQGSLTKAIPDKTNNAAIEMADYFSALFERLPDLPETDLMGVLTAAERTGAIDHEECVALAIDVLLGNYHTTVVSITNAVHAFALFPEQHRILVENPDLAARAWRKFCASKRPCISVSDMSAPPCPSGISISIRE